jgi:aspartyl-tRNA(Asn)/glutamyl-tRNA(Gln) amidotransferase subunit A
MSLRMPLTLSAVLRNRATCYPVGVTRRELLTALLSASHVTARAMAQREDLTTLTLAQASARLAAGAITPAQLTNAYLARIAKMNSGLNAFVTITADLARREAQNLRHAQGPLFGIPIAHKDLFETKGIRTTAGSLLFTNHIPDHNADLVQRLHDAGVVLLGKTNTHELGGGATTINPFFGTTRNPADRTRIAGGSSGGSAAAVAAHLCVAATGSDTGGSIRIPAALCGCVGFKPTHGRLSTKGLIAASPSFDHVGFLTRTVEDAQLIWGALERGPAASPASSIRVGVARDYFFDDLEAPVAEAISQALARMMTGGTVVSDVKLPPSFQTMEASAFDTVFMYEFWGRYGADWQTRPRAFSPGLAAIFKTRQPPVAEYESALVALKAYQADIDRLFESVDVIATPTVPVTAPPIASSIDGFRLLRNTWPFNPAGTPAISIPIRASGLPVGLQLIARRGEDEWLLRIARRLERVVETAHDRL